MVLDGISEDMAELVKTDKYGDIITTDNITMEYYVVKFISEAYTLQQKCKHNGQRSETVELVLRSKYMDFMKVNTNWYWETATKQKIIIIPTHKIVHPSFYVVILTDFKSLSRGVCYKHKARK